MLREPPVPVPVPRAQCLPVPRKTDTVVVGAYDQDAPGSEQQKLTIEKVPPGRGLCACGIPRPPGVAWGLMFRSPLSWGLCP